MEKVTSLTGRQEQLLGLVVRRFIETGQPVGSKTLVESYRLDYSSATVRNELAELDDLGYLAQLHTSAGRIPAELGYRYFVSRLLDDFELPTRERQMIRHQFHQARLDLTQWMRLAAAVLAHTSAGASFVTAPRPKRDQFRHVQLISTQGRMVLMILVLSGGEVQQQMLTLAEPVPQNHLSQAADVLNELFENRSLEYVRAQSAKITDALEVDVAKLIVEIMARVSGRVMSEIYRDGLANLVSDEGARAAVQVLEQGPYLANVVAETMDSEVSGVQIVIGGEGRWEELRNCSVILARYGVADAMSGAVAVIGPIRMSYGRNISAVRYVARLMSGFVQDYYLESVN